MKTHKQFHKELMRDPANRKAHEDLRVEFDIYKALLRARIENKLTQKQLASKIGVTQSALARFESGSGNPTWAFLKKVAGALDLRFQMVKRYA